MRVAVLLVLPLVLASLPAGAGVLMAQERPGPAQAGSTADYAALATGARFTSGSETYVVMPGVHALRHAPDGQPLQQALQALGIAGTALIQKGAFAIYRDAQALQPAAGVPALQVQALAAGSTHPVVYNPRTHGMGVVLGTLVVKMASAQEAGSVAQAAGAQVVQRFDALGLAILAVPAGQDILAAAAAVAGDARVTSVRIEVLEHPRVPR